MKKGLLKCISILLLFKRNMLPFINVANTICSPVSCTYSEETDVGWIMFRSTGQTDSCVYNTYIMYGVKYRMQHLNQQKYSQDKAMGFQRLLFICTVMY